MLLWPMLACMFKRKIFIFTMCASFNDTDNCVVRWFCWVCINIELALKLFISAIGDHSVPCVVTLLTIIPWHYTLNFLVTCRSAPTVSDTISAKVCNYIVELLIPMEPRRNKVLQNACWFLRWCLQRVALLLYLLYLHFIPEASSMCVSDWIHFKWGW